MEFLLEDDVRLHSLELGLEVADGVAMGAAIGATTSIGEGVAIVFLFFAWTAPFLCSAVLLARDGRTDLPVALAATFLLHFLRIGIHVARFSKVTRKVLLGSSGPIGEPSMITVVELV